MLHMLLCCLWTFIRPLSNTELSSKINSRGVAANIVQKLLKYCLKLLV